MPSRTTTSPDGNGGTFTTTVTRDGQGRVTSIDTSHKDANGREIDRDTETRTYHPNGRLSRRYRRRRGPGNRLREETTDWNPDGSLDRVFTDETAGGRRRTSDTHFRNGEPSTGTVIEYDENGVERRRTHEVYGRGGVVRERTVVEQDASGRETRRERSVYDARGRRIVHELALVDRVHGQETVERLTLGVRELVVKVLDDGGCASAVTETRFDPDGALLSWRHAAPKGRGDGWSSGFLLEGAALAVSAPAAKGGGRRKARK